jgi:hypothetical protein
MGRQPLENPTALSMVGRAEHVDRRYDVALRRFRARFSFHICLTYKYTVEPSTDTAVLNVPHC